MTNGPTELPAIDGYTVRDQTFQAYACNVCFAAVAIPDTEPHATWHLTQERRHLGAALGFGF